MLSPPRRTLFVGVKMIIVHFTCCAEQVRKCKEISSTLIELQIDGFSANISVSSNIRSEKL